MGLGFMGYFIGVIKVPYQTWVISIVTLLITLLTNTHEPPSRVSMSDSEIQLGRGSGPVL